MALIRLLVERKRRGWRQHELARRSGVHATSISLIESGRYTPRKSQLQKLARALGVRPDDAERLLEPIALEPLGDASSTAVEA